MTITAAWQQAGSYSADVDRQSLYASMAGTSSTSSIVPRDGCIPDGINPLAVSVSSGMTLNVNAGQAMVAGYTFTNDAATTVTIGTAGASARTDIVVARVRDQAAGDATTSATIEVVQGTTTAPARSIILAQIAVGANVVSINSGNITDKRVYTAGAGGVVPIPGAIASPSLASGLVDGTPVWDASAVQNGVTGVLGIKTGGSVQPVRMVSDTGWQALSMASGFAAALGTVPSYRQIDDRVLLTGAIKPSSGTFGSGGPYVLASGSFNIGTSYGNNLRFAAGNDTNSDAYVNPRSGGLLTAYTTAAGIGAIWLDSAEWRAL